MEETTAVPTEDAEEPVEENKEEKIAEQKKLVKKLEENYEKKPTDSLQFELDRERDMLRHLLNARTENVKYRAEEIADFAREIALGRAIEFAPPE